MATTKRSRSTKNATRPRAAAAHKSRTTRTLNTDPRSLALAVGAALLPWGTAHALPTGENVVAGDVTVTRPTSQSMQINQATQKGIVNWNSFSIGAAEHVNISQLNSTSVLLNRVVGNNPSEIFGRLTANGQVFLVNPNGVLFAPGASVEVGSLFASTLSISNQDFLAGRYQFSREGNAGSVVNQGTIITADGYTALVGPQVRNDGVIIARKGTVALAAADRVSLDLIGDGLISINVDQAALNASIINTGRIEADGGSVLLTARSANALLDTVINTSGVIRANSLVERNGEIVLDGGGTGIVAVSGSLQAAGVDAGTKGGTIKVLGNDVRLMAGASLAASGNSGGGQVLVGGNYQGQGLERNSSYTYVDADAKINADAGTSGNGGKVIVWSDKDTYFFGAISARGGAEAGNGGFVEVSGKEFLAFRGTADRRAPNGKAGTLLLDPTDMTISVAGTSDVTCTSGVCTASIDTSTLTTSDLEAALAGGDVNVDATAPAGAGGGTITWTDGSVDADGNSLTLTGNTIVFNGTLTNVNNFSFSTTPSGIGTASSNGGAINGIGALTFDLTGLNAGTAGGITFNGFGFADSATVTGAVGFDDAARGSLGMTFLSASSVTGSGTISNVNGSFADNTLVSTSSGITYSGTFDTVTGTGGVLTGVAGDFNDATQVSSASSIDYSGFNLGTVSGTGGGTITNVAGSFADDTLVSTASGIDYANFGAVTGTGTTVTGVAGSFNDSTLVSAASGVDYSGLAVATVTGTGGDVTAVAGDFNDATQVSSASSIDYSGFNLGTVSGTGGGTITNVAGSFADDTLVSTASGIDYANFGAVTGTGTTVTGVAGDFSLDTHVSSASAVNYSGFNLGTVAGTGGGTITGTGRTYNLTGLDDGNDGTVSWTNFASLSDVGAGIFNVGAGSLSGSISGGAGSTLSYSGTAGPISVNLQTGAATSITGGFSGIENLVGSGNANDTIAGTDANTDWTINGNNGSLSTGFTYTGFENLNGGTGDDTFLLSSGTLSGAINGGGGSNTLTASNTANTWTITAGNTGTVTGVTGGWSGIQNLVGGSSTDNFTVTSAGTLVTSIDGAGGVNTLNAANVANTWTITSANSGTLNGMTWGNIANLAGGTGTDSFTGTGGGVSGTINDGGGGTTTLTGTITSTGTQTYTGAVSSGAVVLNASSVSATNAGNDFGTLTLNAGSASITDMNALTVGGSVSGALTTNSGALTYATLTAGSINSTASGDVGQTGVVTVTGATNINAGANSITLTFANDFQGAVSITGGTTQITDGVAGPLTFGTLNTGALTVINTGALNLGTGTVNGTLSATSGNGNITQTGALVVAGASTLTAGTGSITLTSSNDFQGIVSGGGTGGISLVDVNTLTLGGLNAGSGVVNLTANAIAGGGPVDGGSGVFTSNTNVIGLVSHMSGQLAVTGSATLWNFGSGSTANPFARTSDTISVQVNGVTQLASLVQLQTASVIGDIAAQVGATIVEEANKTFGTDSVAEDVEYGFAGEIGATPPMDHRIDESGISLPACVQESRDGLPCK